MRKIAGLSVVVLVLVVGLATGVFAQQSMIWNGTDVNAAGITIGTWGSGTAELETKDKKMLLEGNQSIKVTSDGLYMGARLDFKNPVPLAEGSVDPNKYLVLTMFFPDTEYVGPANLYYNTYDIVPYRVPKAEKLRVVIISDTGVKVPIVCPTNQLDPEDNWVRVAVPLSHLTLPQGQSSFNMARLVIATDIPSIIYLAQIKLVTDNTQLKVARLSSQVIAIGDVLYFQGNIKSGVSPVLCSWDFGDGTVIKAGPKTKIVSHQFLKGGDFNVSLTVTDALGIKAPVTVSNIISVSD